MYLDQEQPRLMVVSPLVRDSIKPSSLLDNDYLNSILSTEEVIFNSYLNSQLSPIGSDLSEGLLSFNQTFDRTNKSHIKLVEDRLLMLLPNDWNEGDKKEWTNRLKQEMRLMDGTRTSCFKFVNVSSEGRVGIVTLEPKRILDNKEKLISLLTYYYEAYDLPSLIRSVFGKRLIKEACVSVA